MVTTKKIEYDPELIATYAKGLYDKADLITLYHIAFWGICGGGGAYWYTRDDSIGFFVALSFSFIGYLIGQAKSFQYKLEAQVALCQAQIELNTRMIDKVEIREDTPTQLSASPRHHF